MHVYFSIARFYPYWAVPVALVIGEMAVFFRRRESGLQWPLFGLGGLILFIAILWFVFRGDIHSDDWLKAILYPSA